MPKENSKAEAVRAALASARISGCPVDAEATEVLGAWGRGEITDEDLDAWVEARKAKYLRA